MGIGLKLMNPRNIRDMIAITKFSGDLDKHMKKRCGYCDEMEMGFGADVPVVDFVKHLKEKHADKIDPKVLEKLEKFLRKRGLG